MLIVPSIVSADHHMGFVKGLWFDPYPFFAEEEVSVKVVVFNQGDQVLNGALNLEINDEQVSQDIFTMPPGGLHQPQLTHTFTPGEHEIRVALEEYGTLAAETITIDSVALAQMEVDVDTDGDRVGNKEDPDDDGDGFTDAEELMRGTDPLDQNENPETQALQDHQSTSEPNSKKRSGDTPNVDTPEPSPNKNTGTNNALAVTMDVLQTIAEAEEQIRGAVYSVLQENQKTYREHLQDVGQDFSNSSPADALVPKAWIITDPQIGIIPKILYTLLLFLVFVFSRWWLLIPFLLLTGYLLWRINRWWKNRYSDNW